MDALGQFLPVNRRAVAHFSLMLTIIDYTLYEPEIKGFMSIVADHFLYGMIWQKNANVLSIWVGRTEATLETAGDPESWPHFKLRYSPTPQSRLGVRLRIPSRGSLLLAPPRTCFVTVTDAIE